jgi:hypothetical protein
MEENMKKVTLLGDSIRLVGYGTVVPKMLGEEYEVFQPEDNCRFAKYTLRGVFDWAEGLKGCHVIHWNNGLWDATECLGDGVFTPVDEYVENMLRIAKLLKAITPNVIFATTTPTHPEYPYTHNDKIDIFNAAIVPKLQEMGIEINDLHEVVANRMDYICEDQIHLTDEGFEACAKQVVEKIKKYF